MDRKEKRNISVRSSVRKDEKSAEPKYRTVKTKVNLEESKDSQIDNLKCENKVKDVSIDILSKDIMDRTKRFQTVKSELADREDEIEYLNIVIIDKDNTILRLQEEIMKKNCHIETIRTRLSEQFSPAELLALCEEEHTPPAELIHHIAARARAPNINKRSEKSKGVPSPGEESRAIVDAEDTNIENMGGNKMRGINLLSAEYQPRKRREKM